MAQQTAIILQDPSQAQWEEAVRIWKTAEAISILGVDYLVTQMVTQNHMRSIELYPVDVWEMEQKVSRIKSDFWAERDAEGRG